MGLITALVVLFFIVLVCTFVAADSSSEVAASAAIVATLLFWGILGASLAKAKMLKDGCEMNLPRTEHCVVVFMPEKQK